MYIGSTDYSKIYVGSSAVNKVYKGTTVVYSGYESEALALFARMDEQPSDSLKILINTTIKSLKDSGVWSKLDAVYFRNVHTAQAALLNWIKNTHDSTLANSPIWSPYQGFICTAGKYINTNIDPTTSVLFGDGDYSTIWLDAVQPSAASYSLLGRTAAPQFYWYNYTTSMRAYYLSSNYCAFGVEQSNIMYGTSFIVKLGSDYNDQYINGTWVADRWQRQGLFMSYNLLENYSGNGTRSFSAYGRSLSASDHLVLYNTFQTFKNAIYNLLSFGDELVVNGEFVDESTWVRSADLSWSIAGGKASYNHVTSGSTLTNGSNSYLVIGKRYKLTFTISNASLNAGILFLNHVGTGMSEEFGTAGRFYTNGTYTHYFTATANTRLRLMGYISAGTTSSFDIDNISIKEIL